MQGHSRDEWEVDGSILGWGGKAGFISYVSHKSPELRWFPGKLFSTTLGNMWKWSYKDGASDCGGSWECNKDQENYFSTNFQGKKIDVACNFPLLVCVRCYMRLPQKSLPIIWKSFLGHRGLDLVNTRKVYVVGLGLQEHVENENHTLDGDWSWRRTIWKLSY